MTEHQIEPQPGPQFEFLSTAADICIYGGAAGGGKTFAMIMETLRHIHNPDFRFVFFRRTYPQIMQAGGLWSEAERIYRAMGARPTRNDMRFHFASGAEGGFAHLQHESSKYNYQGAQIALLLFDELTHFTESQFFYLLSRNRSLSGVRPYVRATCNPDADSWVAKLLAWWIDEETGYPIEARSGMVRWFVRIGNDLQWADDPAELEAQRPGIRPKSLTFIPASIYDNQILLAQDPGYIANLMALSLVDRERLLEGNWKIRPEAGKVFNRAWFSVVDGAPERGRAVLFWDLAATVKEHKGADPSYTAGVLLLHRDNHYYVVDCVFGQWGPAEVERNFVNFSKQCAHRMGQNGTVFTVGFETEPGSASKREARRLISLLQGIDVQPVTSRQDKLVRAKPFSVQSENGAVSLVRASWNESWLSHMHEIPDGAHDDIMDATTGAANLLTPASTRQRPRSREY